MVARAILVQARVALKLFFCGSWCFEEESPEGSMTESTVCASDGEEHDEDEHTRQLMRYR